MIYYCCEDERLDSTQWASRLNCDASDIECLTERGILRPDKAGMLRMRFVGIIGLPCGVVFCRPAAPFSSTTDTDNSFREWIENIVLFYRSRSSARSIIEDGLPHGIFAEQLAIRRARLVDLCVSVLLHTAEHGFHRHTHSDRSDAAYGRIDWAGTVSRSVPLHVARGVVYDRPVRHGSIRPLSVLGLLQAITIQEICRPLLGSSIHTPPPAREILEESEDIVHDTPTLLSPTDLLNLAENEIGHRDDERHLLAMMAAIWDEAVASAVAPSGLSLWGVGGFALVWEDMCRFAAEPNGTKDHARARATYTVNDEVIETSPERPDLVLQEHGQLIICDAKYYPSFPRAVPGIDDVRKQVFYGLSHPKNDSTLCFLFPALVPEYVRRVGIVVISVPGEEPCCFPKVYCLAINSEWVGRMYATGRSDGRLPHLVCEACVEVREEAV